MPRRYLTEEEHIKLVQEGASFCVALAGITAAVLRKFPPDVEDYVLYHLQDQTSLFQPLTFKYIERLKED